MARVILKFRDQVALPYTDDVGVAIDTQESGRWTQLRQQFPGIRIRRLYRTEPDKLNQLVARAVANDPEYTPPNFFTFFVIELPPAIDADAVAHTLALWPIVQRAYRELEPSAPSGAAPGTYLLNPLQGYEDPAPIGIDARCAWNIAGGDGTDQAVIDLEAGWTPDHDDFVVHNPQLLFGAIEDNERSHGTSVLGIICARNNPTGVLGIAPCVQSVNVVSYKRDARAVPETNTIPDAIAQAVLQLQSGNVLLLEVSVNFHPCEIDLACYEAIRLATAAGVAVVEPAGNGNQNLDLFLDSAGQRILFRDPLNIDFRDSFAIIVASATSATPHPRRANSNYGARIDCYAWGDSVQTASSTGAADRSSHTIAPDFLNTSAAAAIITGAALSVQGILYAAQGRRFGPAALRAALRQGTPSADPIGVMPDLCLIGSTLRVQQTATAPAAPGNLRIS